MYGADAIRVVQAYFSAMSELHRQEIRDLMAYLRGQVRKATEEELEASMSLLAASQNLLQLR